LAEADLQPPTKGPRLDVVAGEHGSLKSQHSEASKILIVLKVCAAANTRGKKRISGLFDVCGHGRLVYDPRGEP
jgi:hypothetical protein